METLIIAFILVVVLLYLINIWKEVPDALQNEPVARARRDSVKNVSAETPSPAVRRVRWAKQAKRRDITPRGEFIDTVVPL
jgi:hypothetical protein